MDYAKEENLNFYTIHSSNPDKIDNKISNGGHENKQTSSVLNHNLEIMLLSNMEGFPYETNLKLIFSIDYCDRF